MSMRPPYFRTQGGLLKYGGGDTFDVKACLRAWASRVLNRHLEENHYWTRWDTLYYSKSQQHFNRYKDNTQKLGNNKSRQRYRNYQYKSIGVVCPRSQPFPCQVNVTLPPPQICLLLSYTFDNYIS